MTVLQWIGLGLIVAKCDFDANGSICAESGDEEHSILIPRDNVEDVDMNVRLSPSLSMKRCILRLSSGEFLQIADNVAK